MSEPGGLNGAAAREEAYLAEIARLERAIDRLRATIAADGDAAYVLHLTLTIEKLEATIAALLAIPDGYDTRHWRIVDDIKARMAAVVEGER